MENGNKISKIQIKSLTKQLPNTEKHLFLVKGGCGKLFLSQNLINLTRLKVSLLYKTKIEIALGNLEYYLLSFLWHKN